MIDDINWIEIIFLKIPQNQGEIFILIKMIVSCNNFILSILMICYV